ncbi:hypothetical protein V9T40_009662 [Parthenolecanium corni]|uniref:Uncharacterized protein n=1 Tax=Parthenolecanium corni TaxID=536013 RepID=A0AAN9TSS1_9HEMI
MAAHSQEVEFCPEFASVIKVFQELSENDPFPNLNFDDSIMRVDYDVKEYWLHVGFVPCDLLDGAVIRKAFRDLCRLLSLSAKPKNKTLNLACLLSTQLRSPTDHHCLLVDQEKFRSTFRMCNPYSIENVLISSEDEEDFGEPRRNFMYDFLSSVDEMDEEEVLVFGPAFAAIIATLKKCSGQAAANKIFFLKDNLKKFYPQLRKLTVRLPAKANLISLLYKAKEAVHGECNENNLVLGCMFAYHKQDLTAEIKEMLDTLVLKSYRYTSMQLLTFVDEVTKAYGCSVDLYRQLTDCINPIKSSWRAYARFMSEYGPEREPVEGEQNDLFWMYARQFNSRVFPELTYNNNWPLCNLSADLLDLKLNPDKVEAWPVLGPTYQNLTKYKRSKSHLAYPKDHHKWALEIHDIMNTRNLRL